MEGESFKEGENDLEITPQMHDPIELEFLSNENSSPILAESISSKSLAIVDVTPSSTPPSKSLKKRTPKKNKK